jgi:hypothetical protein
MFNDLKASEISREVRLGIHLSEIHVQNPDTSVLHLLSIFAKYSYLPVTQLRTNSSREICRPVLSKPRVSKVN